MQALADYFVESGYDLRALYRGVTNTRVYQLSSRPSGSVEPPADLFAVMAVKTLTSEQLYDSIGRVARRAPSESQDRLADPRRQAFLVKMQTQTQSVTDFELSVPQVLTLMNGPELTAIADPAGSTLLAVPDAPFLDDAVRVETIFLATLARLPRDDERSLFLDHVQSKPAADRQKALGDVVWALLNTPSSRSIIEVLKCGERSITGRRDPWRHWRRFGCRDFTPRAVGATRAWGCWLSLSGWLPALAGDLAPETRRRRHCILLWMNGGPSQIDTFDMKPEHANGGQFKPIATKAAGLQFSEHLPKLATEADQLAVIRSLTTKEGDHGRGTYRLRRLSAWRPGGIPNAGVVGVERVGR